MSLLKRVYSGFARLVGLPHAASSMPAIAWVDDQNFRLDGRLFHVAMNHLNTAAEGHQLPPGTLPIEKTPTLVQRYLELLEARPPKTIIEIGMFKGGSVAFLNLLAKPRKQLGIELSSDRLPILDKFILERNLEDVLRLEYGVDQGDSAKVRTLKDQHIGPGRTIDLVVDDASHILGPTRVTFNTLFPDLAPNADYVIEDHAVAQIILSDIFEKMENDGSAAWDLLSIGLRDTLGSDQKPLHQMAVEAMLAAIVAPGIVRSVTVDRGWLHIVRGEDDIEDKENFDISKVATDYFSLTRSELAPEVQSLLE